MDVDYFQILQINVTFYLQYVWKLIVNVVIKIVETNIIGTGGQRVKGLWLRSVQLRFG